MRIIDLSHLLAETMPVFPGDAAPRIAEASTIDEHGFAAKTLRLGTHTGTHVDAPAHFLAGGAPLDRLPAARFAGPGCLVDVSRLAGPRIEIADLEGERDRIAAAEFVLLFSDWAKRWGSPAYFSGHPALSEKAARWLAGFKLKGVGVDAPSADVMDAARPAVHRIFLSRGIVIIENLTGLRALRGRAFLFACLPLNIAGGDGSPVRAVAIL